MLEGLRHFLLILEHGTFTAAARRAGLSQPALTASIRRLEERMGGTLLHRDRRGARASAAGQALVPHAQAVLTAVADGRRAVAEVQGLRSGEVRIGAGATVCTYLLPPTLAVFRRLHPGIRFRLREYTTDEAMEALAAGRIDLAIVTSDEGDVWVSDELILVAAPGAAPAEAPFVTFRRGATTRALLDRHFPEANIVMELGSIAAVKGHVRAGIGVALVGRSAVGHDLSTGRLVEVEDPRTPIPRTLSVVHRGARRLSPAASALRAHLLGSPPTPSSIGED